MNHLPASLISEHTNSMPYHPDEYLPLSAVSNMVFCERRAALRYVSGMSEANTAMAEGSEIHKRADAGRGGGREVHQYFRVPVASSLLGLNGILDVLEMAEANDIKMWWPVEIKHGKLHNEMSWQVQLCAQVIALEETMSVPINTGEIYYSASHRRQKIEMTIALRERTLDTAMRLHAMVAEARIPAPIEAPKCAKCAMHPACLPSVSRQAFSQTPTND